MATSTLQQPSSLGGERHGVGLLLQRFLQSFAQPLPAESRMAVIFDGASRLQLKLMPRESAGGGALYVQDPLDAENNAGSASAWSRLPPLAAWCPSSAPVPSSGRAWWPRAARHSQDGPWTLGTQPWPPVLELPASKVAHFTAFDRPGACFAFHHVQQVFRGALARLEASLGGPAAAAAAEAQPDLDLLENVLHINC